MSLWKEFKAFAVQGNVIDLAVAVVIGAAFTKIVTALVSGVIMPVIGKGMPKGDWATYTVGGIQVGAVIGAIIDFLLVAMVLFFVVVKLMGALRRKPEAPASKTCPECLEQIPLAARRCRACTAAQPAAAQPT